MAEPWGRAAGLGAVLLIGLLWGLNWPAVKFMLTEIPPFTIRAVALGIAALALGTYAYALGERMIPPRGELPWIALTGLLTIFGFNILITFGQILTETSRAAIIAYTMPALTAVFSLIFLGDRLSVRSIVALVIAMTGIGVMISEDVAWFIDNPIGPLIMLGAATVWALGTVAMKAGTFTLPGLSLTVWFLGLSSLVCWPFVLLFELPLSLPSGPVLAVLLWHALCPMVVGYALWTRIVGAMPASIAAIATLMAPVVGVSSSVLLLNDPVSWQKSAALIMILLSILLTFARRA